MEATRAYPNWPPVLATTGLGVSLAGGDPDHVPLEPELINDARRRHAQSGSTSSNGGSALDAQGVQRLCVRNWRGYAFLRPHKEEKLANRENFDFSVLRETTYFRRTYRHYVPDELLLKYLTTENPPQEDVKHLPKRQGNALAGVNCGDDGHIVFFPTGEVLQQACAWYSGASAGVKTEKLRPSRTSSTVETGTSIRQFAVMGRSDEYQPASTCAIYAAARGAANCTIVAVPMAPSSESDRQVKMHAKAKLTFPEMLYHVAGSPHAEAELAFVTEDGKIHWWEPESGIQTIQDNPVAASERFLRCEYSSHPCVLWAANRLTVSSVDLREPSQSAAQRNTLFDLTGVGSTLVDIYGLKRRTSSPFQFVVGSGVAIEIFDSRMAKQPLMSWSQPTPSTGPTQTTFGALDETNLSRNANDDRGLIISTSQRSKVATLYPFERSRKRARSKVLSLSSLRSAGGDEYSETKCSSIAQYIASDAPLDLPLTDGAEWTGLIGVCTLRNGSTASANVYQLNNFGDLFSQSVFFAESKAKPYHAAVQPDLPCGVTGQATHSSDPLAQTLPMPSDAILPDHDAESTRMFTLLPIKTLLRQFPRLTDGIKREQTSDQNESQEDKPAVDASVAQEPEYDEETLVEKLLVACRPSATLFRLHRYVTDTLEIPLSSGELLCLLQRHSEFHIRNVRHIPSEPPLRVLTPSAPRKEGLCVHTKKGDPRLAVCSCNPEASTLPSPCKSLSCLVPHSLVVSSNSGEPYVEDKAPEEGQQLMDGEFAAAIADAQAVYGLNSSF